jgi:hypothetical protein
MFRHTYRKSRNVLDVTPVYTLVFQVKMIAHAVCYRVGLTRQRTRYN